MKTYTLAYVQDKISGKKELLTGTGLKQIKNNAA
jgi:hypothetical protein